MKTKKQLLALTAMAAAFGGDYSESPSPRAKGIYFPPRPPLTNKQKKARAASKRAKKARKRARKS
jgi:hypothetical protein